MQTRGIAIFGIRAPAYSTAKATAPAEFHPLGRSRRCLGEYRRGAFRLSHVGKSGLVLVALIRSDDVRHAFPSCRS
ncbi:hypothetical protein BJV78DRAFT_1215033 [Lactifluus subvellereus]|nr:hypothetical protein BJV78DRAFT_1215033 [Lactifluus subvellereus]